MTADARDLDWLRRQLIIALAADDELFELLVFKGGNALALAHGVGMRTSIDLDYSLSQEVPSDARLGAQIQVALTDHLSRKGLTLFDWGFAARPRAPRGARAFTWGGYQGEFKVIETRQWERITGGLDQARKQSWGIQVGGGASRKFTIELSKSEYCDGAGEVDVDGFMVRVYTPSMIVAEKLRSLCQQMPQYRHSTKRKPRGRDFYDIHAAVTEAGVNLATPEGHALIRSVFAAKDVPLSLLARLEQDLSFHEGEWDDVRNSIPASRRADFSFYTRFVLQIVQQLEPVWNVDLP